MDWQERVLAAIDGELIARQTLDLVAIPSVTMDEAAVCREYERQLRELELPVEVREVTPGRNNLYVRIPGAGGGPTLMLNGHLDTIPIGVCPPARREGDRIYGRGSTDMKSGMAAMLGAARAILQSGVRLRGDLWLTAVVGHEETEAEKDGPKALIADINGGRLACDRILIVEGRDALWVMSMGSMVFTITLTAPNGGQHTRYIPFGENLIRHMGDLIGRVTAFQEELDATTRHPLAGAERIDLGIAEAGDYFNRTPRVARLVGTRRWMAGKDAGQVLEELRRIVAPVAEAGGLEADVLMEHEREPFDTPTDDPAVAASARAHELVTGRPVEYVGERIVGDANLYVHGSGVPTYYYGPSNETAHGDVEWVSVQRTVDAARVYALTALGYCGTSSQ